jgi:hypothetical protein
LIICFSLLLTTGTVKFFSSKWCGCIEPNHGGNDVFEQISAVASIDGLDKRRLRGCRQSKDW